MKRTAARRTVAALLAAAAAAFVAGCSSSSSPSTSASSDSTAGTALAARISTALDTLRTAHLDIDTGALGGRSTADVVLKGGRATAADIHLTQAGKAVEQITIGGRSYVKVPNASGRPWVLISPTSKDPTAQALATSPGVADVLSSLSVVSGMVRSAQNVQDKGTDSTGHHYNLDLNPRRGTGDTRLDGMLSLLGNTLIPVDLWLDGSDRPVQIQLHISLSGTSFPISVLVSRFNAPLSVAAPPAAQVSTD